MFQDATPLAPSTALASAALSQTAPVDANSQSRVAFLQMSHKAAPRMPTAIAPPSEPTTGPTTPDNRELFRSLGELMQRKQQQEVVCIFSSLETSLYIYITPQISVPSDSTPTPTPEEENTPPPRAPYGTREHALQLRDDLLRMHASITSHCAMLEDMMSELEVFLDRAEN
jgi:hypothetical protein